MDHTALLLAARGLRKSLASLPTAISVVAPGLKAAAPQLDLVLQGYEDLLDRVTVIERRLAAEQRIPDADTIRTLLAGT